MPEAPFDPVTFKFSAAILAIPFGVAAVCAIAAIVCYVRQRIAATVILSIIAALASLIFGPSMLADQVVVTHEKIEQTTGFVWSPTVKGFRYADVSFVHVTEKPVGARGRMTTIWEIRYTNDRTRDFDPGDLWVFHSDAIVPLLEKHGIEFR